MIRLNVLTAVLMLAIASYAQNYKTVSNISYTSKSDAYAQERLKLDVYFPENQQDCPVIVWFHGGGLEVGNKEIPQRLKNKGYVDQIRIEDHHEAFVSRELFDAVNELLKLRALNSCRSNFTPEQTKAMEHAMTAAAKEAKAWEAQVM